MAMDTTKEDPTYLERMAEPFPDVNEELEKFRVEAQQKNFTIYFRMMNALHKGRRYSTRTNSWDTPEKHRKDETPYTKSSRASRVSVSRRKSKAARASRKVNR